MTKHEQYNLIFIKKCIEKANAFDYFVEPGVSNDQTEALAYIVRNFFKQTGGDFIQEIEEWEIGMPYESDYIEVESIGGAEWRLKLAPPNVLYYNDMYKIPILDFKEIIQEWFAFDNS